MRACIGMPRRFTVGVWCADRAKLSLAGWLVAQRPREVDPQQALERAGLRILSELEAYDTVPAPLCTGPEEWIADFPLSLAAQAFPLTRQASSDASPAAASSEIESQGDRDRGGRSVRD